MGEQVFILTQDVGDNREHAWKRGHEAGYPNILIVIPQITRYFVKFDIFWKIKGLGESQGCPWPGPRRSPSC